jgi:cytochrome c1
MIELITQDGYTMYVERHILEHFDDYKAFLKIQDIMSIIPFPVPVYDKASMTVIFQLIKEYEKLCKSVEYIFYINDGRYKQDIEINILNTIINGETVKLINDKINKIANLFGQDCLIHKICTKYESHIKKIDPFIYVYAKNYNILRVFNGCASLQYD